MKNRTILNTLIILGLGLSFTACKFETEHTINDNRDKNKEKNKNKNNLEADEESDDQFRITSVSQIALAVENDASYFTNDEKDYNWHWYGDTAGAHGNCQEMAFAARTFDDPEWVFNVGCQFVNTQCNESGWYEQVHHDFLLVQIVNIGEHINPTNCLGSGTYLCEFALDDRRENTIYNCEPTDDEVTIHEVQ